MNRLTQRSTTGGSPSDATVSFTYTNTGKRHSMTDASGTTNYSYDSMDRLTQKQTPEGTLNYTYDGAGNLATMQSADGAVNASYNWDSLNRLQTVVDSRLGTTTYAYDNANNVFTVAYPNGVTTTYGYDALNRVSGLGYNTQTGVYAYGRDNTGKLTSASEPSGRSVTWSFDGINRLTSESITEASGTNYAASYGLDPVGNRSSESSSIPGVHSGTWSFNADDELSSEQYDNNGNVTSASGKTFAYDSENHLTSMNSGHVTIVYDGDGNRVTKNVSGTVTGYLVDDLNPTGYPQVVEEVTSGAASRTYTYGLQRISEYQPIQGAWTPSFYIYDGGGNVRQLTSSGGTVTDTYEYDAFGNAVVTSANTPNNYLYRGEQWDPDLGLYYLRARYYNATTGRFMARDPEDGWLTNPATLHKYLYTAGDPLNLIDPTGRNTAVLKPVWGGSFGEYTGLISAISLKTVVQVAAVGVATACLYDFAASQLGYEPAFSFCAKKSKYSCTAKCTCHVIGGEDHENTGTFVFGSGVGYSLPEARNAAKRDAGLSCAVGQHAQHCSYQCTQ